jgi:hypothetical protein
MKAPKVILTGVLVSLCLITVVQAADYREEPYAEVETRYHSRGIEMPQEHPLPPRFHEERTYHEPRYVEEERVDNRPRPGWRSWSRPVAVRPWHRPGEDCRVIIKRRENQWGEVTVRRIQVCD